ncbi:MAG: discoidin domain-containing protein, partial [Bacteroidaceae bacterium]|nr:discoidin domain-containing protein [Bacteroidaceae bacterium]
LLTLKAQPGTWTIKENENSVTLTVKNTYKGNNGTNFTTDMSYEVMSDGTISVSSVIDPAQKNNIIPKLGFMLTLPKGTEEMTWYGRGPWENYRDRKESCHVGLYHSNVLEQWTPYMLPQENGNHEEVRFMAAQNAEGQGVMVVAPQLMSSAVVRCKPSNIYTDRDNRKKHDYEVSSSRNTFFCIDAVTRGLGNNSCGPDVLPQYELKAQRVNFSFIIMPLTKKATNEELVAMSHYTNSQCQPVTITETKGVVKLSCDTQKALIQYSTDNGTTWNDYNSQGVNMKNGGTILARATCEGLTPSIITSLVVELFVDKTGWKVVSKSSEQGGTERADYAIDGNPSTIWHTQYNPTTPKHPHEIVIDMAQVYTVKAFIYQGRSDSNNGRIKDYEVYFSNDLNNWETAALKGQFQNNASEQKAVLSTPIKARYFKLVALSEVNGNAWASAAELGIEASESSTNIQNSTINCQQSTVCYNLKGVKL